MLQYEQDYDTRLPPRHADKPTPASWRSIIYPYIKSTQVFRCPVDPASKWHDLEHDGFNRSYAVNSAPGGPFDARRPYIDLDKVTSPGFTIGVVESTAAYADFNPLEPSACARPTDRHHVSGHLFAGHKGYSNVLFLDGHVRTYSVTAALFATSNSYYDDHEKEHKASANLDPWTIDCSPFSSADQVTLKGTLNYARSQDEGGH